jgi:hypothetical protein
VIKNSYGCENKIDSFDSFIHSFVLKPCTYDGIRIATFSIQIIDGQIVLQESSVVLPSRRTVQEVEEEFRDNVVEEDEQLNIVQASYTSFVTKGDHGKVRKKGSWSIEETEKFYFALQQLGTDFGSMEALLFENQRTRKQLKNKYRKELAKNPDLVQELALNPKYQIQLGTSVSIRCILWFTIFFNFCLLFSFSLTMIFTLLPINN